MTHPLQRICLAMFFVVIVTVSIGDAVLSSRGLKPPGEASDPAIGRPPLRWLDVWKGNWTPACELWLKNRSWLVHGTAAKYREWAFQFFQRTPNTIVVGKHDWLFYPATVASRTREDLENQGDIALRKIEELHQRYEALHVQMVVLLIPDAATVFPEEVPSWVRNESARRRFLPWFAEALEKKGIPTFNATQVMRAAADHGAKVYFKADNHWTYAGAETAVQGLAGFLRQRAPELVPREASAPIYKVDWKHVANRSGAWRRKFGFSEPSAMAMRFGDAHEAADFVRLRTEKPCVAWVGTSFSDFGSPEFFANAIGMEVERLTRPAKGSLYSLGWALKYLESNPDARTPLVVLEVPEYHITSEYDGGFNRMNVGMPPFPGTLQPVEYKLGHLVGLSPLGPDNDLTPLKATDRMATLQLKFKEPIQDLTFAMSVSKSGKMVVWRAKEVVKARQPAYDGTGVLEYRATRTNPSKTWELTWFNLEPGQTLEIGRFRQPTPAKN